MYPVKLRQLSKIDISLMSQISLKVHVNNIRNMPEAHKNSTVSYSTNISVYQVNHRKHMNKFKGNSALQVN